MENLERNVAKAGKVLRLLTNLVEPMRIPGDVPSLPQLDSSAQKDLVSVVQGLLLGIVGRPPSNVSSDSTASDHVSMRQTTAATIFLARVLQFMLGFPGAWVQWAKDSCETLSRILSRLILVSRDCCSCQTCLTWDYRCRSMVLVQPWILSHFLYS